MAGGSHQTMRLARGRHKSPADGACVMELASMLAGERFSDHPRCVDPVIRRTCLRYAGGRERGGRLRVAIFVGLVCALRMTIGARSGPRARRSRATTSRAASSSSTS